MPLHTHRVVTLAMLVSVAICATCLIYWPSSSLPFIQDDWSKLQFFRAHDVNSLLSSIIRFDHKFFYRPLGEIHLLTVYEIFGANPVAFHVIALGIHAANAVMVGLIARKLFQDTWLTLLSAIIYASAIAVHLDTLSWAVGIYDLGGAFCFLSAILLYMHGKWRASVILYVSGCLFKESIILLPFILLAYALLIGKAASRAASPADRVGRAIAFLICMAVIAAIKVSGELPTQQPSTHPYSLVVFGPHLITNAFSYLTWQIQAFIPIGVKAAGTSGHVLVSVTLVLLLVIALLPGSSARAGHWRILLFLGTWIVIGLIPVIFLPNHTFRYYATYSLAGFVLLVLYLARHLSLQLGWQRSRQVVLFGVLAMLAVTGSAYKASRIYQEGLTPHTFADGTNVLIRRAAYVDIVRDGLARLLPHPPAGAQIIMSHADIWAFDRSSGPRCWYQDNRIDVYDIADIRFSGDDIYVADFAATQADAYTGGGSSLIRLEPSRSFFFEVVDGVLRPIGADAMQRLREMSSGRLR